MESEPELVTREGHMDTGLRLRSGDALMVAKHSGEGMELTVTLTCLGSDEQ